MKKSILCFWLLIGSLALYAQGEPKNAIQVDWGIGTLNRQDLSFSSLIHQSITPINTQITYQRKGSWTHEVSTRFSLFKEQIVDPYTFFHDKEHQSLGYVTSTQFVFLDVNYGLSREVLHSDKWSVLAGARERNRLQVTDFTAGDGTHFAYYFCFGIDVKATANFNINGKSSLHSNLYLPIFSHVARNPYSAQDGAYFYDSRSNKPIPTVIEYIKGGSLQSWNKSQILDFDLSYAYQLSNRWSVGAKYLLTMNFNQKPNTLNSIENYYYLTTQIQF